MPPPKPVIITTTHRGVFFGRVPSGQDMFAADITLNNATMVIRWGTIHGLGQLAATGPTPKSKLSSVVTSWHLRDISSVLAVTSEAATAFDNAVPT